MTSKEPSNRTINLALAQQILGILIRVALMKSKYQNVIIDRFEVSTPINSWKRIKEALYLVEHQINPYKSNQFHELPLSLAIYKFCMDFFTKNYIFVLYILFDAMTPMLIYVSVKLYLKRMYEEQRVYLEERRRIDQGKGDCEGFKFIKRSSVLLKASDIEKFPRYCYMFYIFNPFSVLNCVGQTSTVFSNFMKAGFLYGIASGNCLISAFYLSAVVVFEMYPVGLFAPFLITFCFVNNRFSLWSTIKNVLLTACLVFAMIYPSKILMNGWSFIENVYEFTLNVEDFTPNVGVFWYFFQEMFEHFRPLFIFSYQLNALFLYLVPLSLKLYKDPFFLSVVLISYNTIFIPFPNVGHLGFYFSLFPAWTNLFPYLHQGFIVIGLIINTFPSGIILSYQWLITNSANANFYFATTSLIICAQIFLLTDFLFVYLKKEFWMKNDCKGMNLFKTMKLNLEN